MACWRVQMHAFPHLACSVSRGKALCCARQLGNPSPTPWQPVPGAICCRMSCWAQGFVTCLLLLTGLTHSQEVPPQPTESANPVPFPPPADSIADQPIPATNPESPQAPDSGIPPEQISGAGADSSSNPPPETPPYNPPPTEVQSGSGAQQSPVEANGQSVSSPAQQQQYQPQQQQQQSEPQMQQQSQTQTQQVQTVSASSTGSSSQSTATSNNSQKQASGGQQSSASGNVEVSMVLKGVPFRRSAM